MCFHSKIDFPKLGISLILQAKGHKKQETNPELSLPATSLQIVLIRGF